MNTRTLHTFSTIIRSAIFIGIIGCAFLPAFGQTKELTSRLSDYFQAYQTGFITEPSRCSLKDVKLNDTVKVVHVYAGEVFGMQQFTAEKVKRVYDEVRRLLPSPYQDWKLVIYAKDIPIDELVIGGSSRDYVRTWDDISHQGPAWVTPLSRPYEIKYGLDGRHLCLWASHGRFYSQDERQWRWQRPRLFCTTEDLLSQTFVVPLLMPMLENAGAILVSPRERDWQRNEVIVDNDTPDQDGIYAEATGHWSWEPCDTGFAHLKTIYFDGDAPFSDGTSRQVKAQSRTANLSTACWQPAFPAEGSYAVYVAYTTVDGSVPDAHYTVRHRGIDTQFQVNQQMGGRTWVYLGTFDFDSGCSEDNCVLLTNQSEYQGVVTADAVRFGGGMGCIARGPDSLSMRVSGMPKFLEAARYGAQWAGMPYYVYGNKQSANDYAEDINTRSLMCNYLAGGSCYLPSDTGLHVPIELNLAFHTDAGYTRDHTPIGTLGIYTTFPNEGLLPSGLTRLTSRDLCDRVLSQVQSDLAATYGQWTRRQMFDRNYSETREPLVPSIITEMLSHQNFADLMKGHDPHFKFTLARAVYKGVLRFIASMH